MSVCITPVMYSDITGMSPEAINVVELVGAGLLAIGAIVIGVLALTTSLITLPALAATFLICGGVSVLLDMIAIGKAQYNYSVESGKDGGEIFDDVIDAVGSNSMDRVLYHAGLRVFYLTAEQGVGAAVALLLEAQNPAYSVSYVKSFSKISYITFTFLAIRGVQTVRTFINDEFAYDYAYRMEWRPWED